MPFPAERPRRLRKTPAIRALVRETRLLPEQLMLPFFVVNGKGVEQPISSMPGQSRLSVDRVLLVAERAVELGIRSVLLFGIPDQKDEKGLVACKDDGIVQRAVRELKQRFPELLVVTDLCFCEYTSHGHCGLVSPTGELLNDESVELLVQQGLSHARAGVDMVAPSGMLDGMIAGLRQGFDEEGFSDLPIMSYAAKYSSAFYGPFREAVDSAPQFGDRRSYQMDPANSDEAMREIALDIEEGADIVMVKPALAYLDIIRRTKDTFSTPIAAYNVSGEYAMVKAAAAAGWIDETRVMVEMLGSMHRAGADIIITYFAIQYAEWINS